MTRFVLLVIFILIYIQGYLMLPRENEVHEICIKNLGCFRNDGEFKDRPFSMLPDDKYEINAKYKLYTRENSEEPVILDPDAVSTITEAPFSREGKTRIIVHGFLNSALYGKWMEEMKNAFLIRDNDNVIIVDWEKGSNWLYSKTVANARVVGAEISYLISQIHSKIQIGFENFHIIGHNVGAHVAGYAGERTDNLGRITGLDPIGMYFENTGRSVRLDESDAEFVDVIHTDIAALILGKMAGLGMQQLSGHIDFYPNNGRQQPGCQTKKLSELIYEGLIEGTKNFILCNHKRAIEYFIQSINYKSLKPIAYTCSSWKHFTEGKCASCGNCEHSCERCAPMGLYANTYKPPSKASQNQMYVETKTEKPFWLYEYQISLQLSRPDKNSDDASGMVKINIAGELFSFPTQRLILGAQYRYLISSEKDFGDINEITFRFKNSLWDIIFRKYVFAEYIEIKPMSSGSKWEELKPMKFCLVEKKDTPLYAGTEYKFHKQSCATKNDINVDEK